MWNILYYTVGSELGFLLNSTNQNTKGNDVITVCMEEAISYVSSKQSDT